MDGIATQCGMLKHQAAAGGGGGGPSGISGYTFELDSTTASSVLEGTGPDDLAENGDGVVQWNDISGNGHDFTVDPVEAFYTDPGGGASWYLDCSKYNGPVITLATNPIKVSSASLFVVLESNDSSFGIVQGDLHGEHLGFVVIGALSPVQDAGSPTCRVGTTIVTSRTEIKNEVNGQGIVVVSFIGADLSGWDSLNFCGLAGNGYGMTGKVYAAIGYDEAVSDADRATIVSYLESKYS